MSIEKPKPPYECIEHAIDPDLYEKMQEEDLSDKQHSQESPWKEDFSKLENPTIILSGFPAINKNGKFPCLNPDCGYGASFGRTGSDYWDTWIKSPGRVFVGREEHYDSSYSDYRPIFEDCPKCNGTGNVTWKKFKLAYDMIMKKHDQELQEYETNLSKALKAKEKLTKTEFDSIVAYLV